MADLPQEILTEFLKRLPVKSILGCKCVCKEWSFLIESPIFIDTHLSHSSFRNSTLIVQFNKNFTLNTSAMLIESLDVNEVVLTANSLTSFPRLMGSCNGLIGLDVSRSYIVLWNPATRKFRRLPQPIIKDSEGKLTRMDAVGLGFDEVAKDYKIVRIMSCGDIKDGLPEKCVEIFSRIISSLRIYPNQHAAMGDGSLHWVAYGTEGQPYGTRELAHQDFLLSFDIKSEEFKRTLLPFSLICRKVVSYEGSVHLVGLPRARYINHIELWMNEKNVSDYVWKREYVLEALEESWLLAAMWKDGEAVIISEDRNPQGKLFSYDLNNHNVERLPDKGDNHYIPILYNFTESLVPVTRP